MRTVYRWGPPAPSGTPSPLLYIERPDGLFDVLDSDGLRPDHAPVLVLPDNAEELLTAEQARNDLVDLVTETLAAVPMSIAVQERVDAALHALRTPPPTRKEKTA